MEVIFLADFTPGSCRRGRPAGKSRLFKSGTLSLHDLAFMRAVLQGVDLESAAERFLPEIHADLRVIRAYLSDVAQQAHWVLRNLGRHQLASALTSALFQPQTPVAPALPSLADFAQELDDPDAWSEAELLELYQDRYGQVADRSCTSVPHIEMESLLQGLTLIQNAGVRIPSLSDEISSWLSAGIARHLGAVGISALSDLTTLVRLRGKHWYRAVPGIGKERGLRLTQWLRDHVNFLEPAQANSTPLSASKDLSLLTKPSAGALLRSSGSNALGAQSDHDALLAWMATLHFLSPHTQKAYTRDVARLVYWAHKELGKGLSELSVVDAVSHARFLQNPPAHWCLPSSKDHMTMRGPLSPSSTSRALAAIGHFYGYLVETLYLKANPFSRIRYPQERGVQMDVQRCFSNVHLALIQQVLIAMPDGPKKRRLVAILALLESTGLRIGEIPSSWSSVIKPFDPEAGKVTCLKVIGKGGRERLLPLKEEVIQALQRHAADQQHGNHHQFEACPLIGCIDEPVHLSGDSTGALSTARLRVVLKAFFQEVAKACESPEMAADFRRATPHFLRHTFAHRVLHATQGDLVVTQQLLGHKSITTTGIYVKADLTQRLQAIESLSIQTIKASQGVLA